MKGLRNTLLSVAGLLALVVAVPSLFTPVMAQVRAALVKNVDEPGLVPFTHTFSISTSVCGCSNCCFPETPAVPAGKRLVLTSVSGFLPLAAAGNLGPIVLQQHESGPPATFNTVLTLPAAFRTQWNGGDYPAYEFNHQVQAFIEPGATCRLSVFGGSSWSAFNTGQITLNGYLVTLP